MTQPRLYLPRPKPPLPTCALCGSSEQVETLGTGRHICHEDIAIAVSLAANLWPNDVRYTARIENYLMS